MTTKKRTRSGNGNGDGLETTASEIEEFGIILDEDGNVISGEQQEREAYTGGGAFVNPNARLEYAFTAPDGSSNVITYRAKMTISKRSNLQKDLLSIKINSSSPDSSEVLVSEDAQNIAIIQHNVIKWSGDWFSANGRPVRYSKQAVLLLDPEENDFWIDPLCDLISRANNERTLDDVDENGIPTDFLEMDENES